MNGPTGTDMTMDQEVLERIQSRASITMDTAELLRLREKYKEGFYRLDRQDRRDPHNWSLRRRLLHQLCFGMANLLAYGCAGVFAPLVRVAVRPHGVELGELSFGIFLIGNAVGPFLFPPLCSLFGRLASIYVPLLAAGLAMCVCANLEYASALVVYRFLAGVLASGPLCSLRGASADIWLTSTATGRLHELAIIWSSFCVVLGSAGAPVLGALLVYNSHHYGWRWACWLSGLTCVFVSVLCLFLLGETYLPVIEQRACKEERLDTGFWGLHCAQDSYRVKLPSLKLRTLRPTLILLRPNALPPVVFSALNFGVLFLLIAAAPQQLRKHHPTMSFVASYACLLALPTGYLVACWVNIVMARPRRAREWYSRMLNSSSNVGAIAPKPETQLRALLALGWLLPGGLFMFGWGMYKSVHWIVPVVGLALVGGALSVNVRGCHFYLHDAYPGYFQLTSSTCIIVQSLFGGVAPLFANQLFNALGVHWGASLMAFISLFLYALVCVVALFGHLLRQYDPAATHTS